MQFFESIRWAPGRAASPNRCVALWRFNEYRLELLVRRHVVSSHERIPLSSKSLSSCYTWPPITDQQSSGGVAERLIAPVLKTGRPIGLVSSNLTPSALPGKQVETAGWHNICRKFRLLPSGLTNDAGNVIETHQHEGVCLG